MKQISIIFAFISLAVATVHAGDIVVEQDTTDKRETVNIYESGIPVTSCECNIENWLNSQTSNFAALEWNLNKRLPEEKGKITLYGFKTVFIPENERQKYMDTLAGHTEEMKKQNTVFAGDYSSCRFYFPFSEAIVEYEGTTYTAAENGRVEIPGTDVYKISITGRAPSEKVKGSRFKNPLKPENDSHVLFGQSTLIFDCGEFNGME
jgi:hypothetical protein